MIGVVFSMLPAAPLAPESPYGADLVHQVRDASKVTPYRPQGVQVMHGVLGAAKPSGEPAEVAAEVSAARAVALRLTAKVSCFLVQLV